MGNGNSPMRTAFGAGSFRLARKSDSFPKRATEFAGGAGSVGRDGSPRTGQIVPPPPCSGSGHRDLILQTLDIPVEKSYSTYEYLGNIGTVSLPLTAALAEEREFLLPGDRVGFLGIGSGLNCLMLGFEW